MSRMPHTIGLSGDREKALAMFDVSRETVARLDRFVELLLAWQRRTNLIAPSTIPSLWTRHVADSLQLVELVQTPAPHPLPNAGEGREGGMGARLRGADSLSPCGGGSGWGVVLGGTRVQTGSTPDPSPQGGGEEFAASSSPDLTPMREGGVWLDLGSGGGFPGIVIACALADAPGTRIHLIESNMKKAAFLREAVRETKVPGIVHADRIETLVPALGAVADYVTARALAPLPDLLEMIAPFLKKGAKALLPKGQDLDIELTRATKRWSIEAESVPSKTSRAGRILIVHALSKRT
jgi:16S rRNA G527 N7-methylase RsmG